MSDRNPDTQSASLFERGDAYRALRRYETPALKPKHMRQYDHEFWNATGCRPGMSVLEVGCGTGQFLAYLAAKGVEDFVGIDADGGVRAAIPEAAANRFVESDLAAFVAENTGQRRFDRVVLFDVLEHLTLEQGIAALESLHAIVADGGRLAIRVPNGGSPWGLHIQHSTIDHVTIYTTDKLIELARLTGYDCLRFLPQKIGPPVRRTLQAALHAVLDRVLVQRPEVWTANVVAVFARPHRPGER